MSDLLKKADAGRFPDDNWREILHVNGFAPSGVTEEMWRSPHSNFRVKIDVDRETEEPYYQIITEDGTQSVRWTDPEMLKSIVEPREPEPPKLSPEEEETSDRKFLKSVGIVGRQRTSKKFSGRAPRFSFAVPTNAAGPVAFHLAKAGMKDFDVEHFKEDEFSMFMFPTEPEMHVAEEIVKAEFADQIKAQKGWWRTWSETPDPTQVKSERELSQPKQYVSSASAAWRARQQGKFAGQWGERSYDSDAVHDILDRHRNTDRADISFDDPVPDSELPALLKELDRDPAPGSDDDDHYLGVVVFLATHGSNVPRLYRERARQIALAQAQDEAYLQEWADPEDRRAELENEIRLLEDRNAKAAARAVNEDVYTGDQIYRRILDR